MSGKGLTVCQDMHLQYLTAKAPENWQFPTVTLDDLQTGRPRYVSCQSSSSACQRRITLAAEDTNLLSDRKGVTGWEVTKERVRALLGESILV